MGSIKYRAMSKQGHSPDLGGKVMGALLLQRQDHTTLQLLGELRQASPGVAGLYPFWGHGIQPTPCSA